jgi:GNAT superfamily N-acetyltransferase
MIRVAETRDDLERCVEICSAVHPDDPVVVDQLVDSDGAFLLHDGGCRPQRRRGRGCARLYETGTPHRLENGLTAVLPSHRRRGIAIALKRAEFAWAAHHRYREVVTEMAAGNAAMRAVNERLGYRPLPASIVVSGSLA